MIGGAPLARLACLLTVLPPCTAGARPGSVQAPLQAPSPDSESSSPRTTLQLSKDWIALGPFPAGMRELPFGADPARAFGNLAYLLDPARNISLPSVYSWRDDGTVPLRWIESRDSFGGDGGATVAADEHVEPLISHRLTVDYTDVPWEYIRATAGWSALQWQATMVADMLLEGDTDVVPDTMAFAFDQVAEFAFVPAEEWQAASQNASADLRIEWHTGDWYSYNRPAPALAPMSRDAQPSSTFAFPHRHRLQPGKYKLLIRAAYELRIFGEPRASSEDGRPVVHMGLDIARVRGLRIITDPSTDAALVPSVVGGWLAGYGIKLGLQNAFRDAVEISDVRVRGAPHMAVQLQLEETVKVQPIQGRTLALLISQSAPLGSEVEALDLSFRVCLVAGRNRPDVHECWWQDVSVPLQHRKGFSGAGEDRCGEDEHCSFLFTYLSPFKTIELAAATPPKSVHSSQEAASASHLPPVVLALHGAGVSAADPGWAASIRRPENSWVILPSGGSGWGFDWQLRTHDIARSALHEMAAHLYGVDPSLGFAERQTWAFDPARIVVLGHSNGGHGAAYFMSRRPDEVIGGVVAAGYSKLSEYVSFDWQQGRHFTNGALGGVLRSSLHMFENDLHASNLAGIPILWKYGTADDNVPPHHSPLINALVSQWNAQTGHSLNTSRTSRVPGQGHWYDEMMSEPDVQAHIDQVLRGSVRSGGPVYKTVLTVANPHEMGSKNGWRVTRLAVPGRPAQLKVISHRSCAKNAQCQTVHEVELDNVADWTFEPAADRAATATEGDEHSFKLKVRSITAHWDARSGIFAFNKDTASSTVAAAQRALSRPLGPMLTFVNSEGPIQIILPTNLAAASRMRYEIAAKRFVADLRDFGRLDVVFYEDNQHLTGATGSAPSSLGRGNVLVLGGPRENRFAEKLLRESIFDLTGQDTWRIGPHELPSDGLSLLALQKHPRADVPQGLALVLAAADDSSALQRAAKLLTVRTGTTVPEWIVLGPDAEWQGAGGVRAAGWYDNEWQWSESMSYCAV